MTQLPFQLDEGMEPLAPLVLDSPHSGHVYPEDFRFECPKAWLQQTEDAFVDELFSDAPALGMALQKALFARSYIDVNRAENDIDPRMLEDAWPVPLHPSERSLAGHGLIRHICRGQPVYGKKIPSAEIQCRLENYYRPYHAMLQKTLQERRAQFGTVWHINCHSMPSLFQNPALAPHGPAVDFIVGDRDGHACEKAFSVFVTETLRGMGYRVGHNDPYKGAEIIARYGRPTRGVHCLQLEISRALYMDEKTLERGPGFTKLKANLEILLQEWQAWAAQRLGPQKLAAE